MRNLAPLVLPTLVATIACGTDPVDDPVPGELVRSNLQRDRQPVVPSADLAETVAGNTAFAFALYDHVRTGPGNRIFSPYGVSLALVMPWAGARGETERQLAATMGFGLPQARQHAAFNALDLDLFLRIAPELFLKRLLVGGLERVYEIGRCFRNEGLSTKHNPEFTMLEFYEAYATCDTVLERTEEMLCRVDERLLAEHPALAEGRAFRLERPFRRLRMADAIVERGAPAAALSDPAALQDFLAAAHPAQREAWGPLEHGGRLYWLFETLIEPNLGPQPVFVLGYPAAVSPLARPNDADPLWTDRFELFIGGHEIANAFSELNDPELQAERFRAQVEARRKGDAEAMQYDVEYVQALEHGMPPAGGFGLGVDRLTMLLCGVDSIREAILFPLRRPVG